MRRRRLLALSSGIVAASLAGCIGETEDGTPGDDDTGDSNGSDDGTGPDDGTGGESDADQLDTLVRGANAFAFDLYGELLDERADENLFASPVSISLALAMTYAGAREGTREEMREVLRYELDDEAVHAAYESLQAEFDRRSEATDDDEEGHPFELSVANSVWGQEEYPFEDAYLDVLESHYGSGLREVDFQADAERAREEINDWVADETEDRIDDLLPPGSLDELTRLVLVNAVYFLANWKHTFDEDLTEAETFTALDGEEHEVQMMRQEHSWPYAEVNGAQAVDLPYVGEDVSMLVVLPPEGEFESYEAEFDEETLDELVDALEREEGTVHLPRFEFEGGFELGDPLRALGMTDAFDPNEADFDGIADTEESLFIHEAFHDTFVSVDEEGTEAAAATAVVIGTESAPADPFEFVADRPFLFAIRDRPTGSLLFFGRAVDPAGWE